MDFMQEFRPRENTIRLHDAVALQLAQLDRLIKTSNNIHGKQVAEHLLTTTLGMYQWMVSQSTDFADYMQAIVSHTEDEGGIDDNTFEVLLSVHTHLKELQNLFEEMKAILPENVLVLGNRNQELVNVLGEILDSSAGVEEDESLFDDESENETSSDSQEEVTV